MLPEKKHHAVNWIDGMKLNKDHFINSDRWVNDLFKDALSLIMTDYSYGLTEPLPGEDTALDIIANFDGTNQLNIKVLTCRGITRGGYRVEITPRLVEKIHYPEEKLAIDFNLREAGNEDFVIIVSANTDEQVPTGVPNEEEVPFRHPFALPQYKLHIVPFRQVSVSQASSNHIIIGRFQIIAGNVEFNERYIPPCTCIKASPSLSRHYHNLKNLHDNIVRGCVEYIRKQRNSGHKIDQNITYVFEKLVFHTVNSNFSNEQIILSEAPIFFIDYFIQMARTFRTALSCLAEYEREEIMNYFNKWVASRDFDNFQYDLINLEYSHLDIYQSIETIERYLIIFHSLVDKLVFSDKTIPEEKAPEPKPEPQKSPKVKIVRLNK